MNNMNTLIANLHKATHEPKKEIEALQKELDELKASIPKIKADAVRGFANNMRDITGEASLMGHEGIMQMSSFAAKSAEAYANQLEGKE